MNETDAKYISGWLPIPDTRWKVETIVNGRFKTLGTFTVKGSVVGAEMDAHHTIKGYEPCDIAHKMAGEKFPNANPIMISKVW